MEIKISTFIKLEMNLNPRLQTQHQAHQIAVFIPVRKDIILVLIIHEFILTIIVQNRIMGVFHPFFH